MTIKTVRRLAAEIMGVGENKVRISAEDPSEVKGALTRADVKGLIEKGVIKKAKPQGRASTKRYGRRGRGSRKGKTVDRKKLWMQKVRAQRKFLRMLLETGVLDPGAKRSLYGKIKSGIFRSTAVLLHYLKDNGLVPEDYEPPKKIPEEEAETKEEGGKE